MSDFKEGDEVFYLEVCSPYTYRGAKPSFLNIKTFTAVNIPEHSFALWVKNIEWDRPFLLDSDMAFKSKQECIDAFKKRLDEL